jgi:hypothetical protein
MRRAIVAACALLAAACVSKVVGTTAEFPGRARWQGCVRERLEGMGFAVTGDSTASTLRGRSPHIQITVVAPQSANDTSAVPLRVTLDGEDRSALDSLVIYCSRMSVRPPS